MHKHDLPRESTDSANGISSSTITESFRDGTHKLTHVFWALDALDEHQHDE